MYEPNPGGGRSPTELRAGKVKKSCANQVVVDRKATLRALLHAYSLPTHFLSEQKCYMEDFCSRSQ
eukprot:5284223-Amphidinium_carterae.2